MEKAIRNGYVAVIHSTSYGHAWFDGNEQILFDPEIVYMIENDRPTDELRVYCERVYGHNAVFISMMHNNKKVSDFLGVKWVREGTDFYIHEYDGLEEIRSYDPERYIKA